MELPGYFWLCIGLLHLFGSWNSVSLSSSKDLGRAVMPMSRKCQEKGSRTLGISGVIPDPLFGSALEYSSWSSTVRKMILCQTPLRSWEGGGLKTGWSPTFFCPDWSGKWVWAVALGRQIWSSGGKQDQAESKADFMRSSDTSAAFIVRIHRFSIGSFLPSVST